MEEVVSSNLTRSTRSLNNCVLLDKFSEWPEMPQDVRKRPFITAGFADSLLTFRWPSTARSGAPRWLDESGFLSLNA